MPTRPRGTQRTVSPAARVFSSLEADDNLLPGHASALQRSGALFLALLVLSAVPFFLAANAAGLIGDVPAAVAKSSNSGPGGGSDDDNSGPGSGDDDDDTGTNTGTGTRAGTNDTSANGHSTRGTTNDNDTRTNGTNTRTGRAGGTNDTSANGHSTRGTTNDNDTRTGTGMQTRTRTGSR